MMAFTYKSASLPQILNCQQPITKLISYLIFQTPSLVVSLPNHCPYVLGSDEVTAKLPTNFL
jgi:hypothetical protein